MKSFEYRISSPDGIHARPAGFLVKKAQEFSSEVTVSFAGKSASARKLFALMKLGVKQNDVVAVTAEGSDEDAAIAAISSFMTENF